MHPPPTSGLPCDAELRREHRLRIHMTTSPFAIYLCRHVVGAGALGLVLWIGAAQARAVEHPAAPRPNIIFILADDLGYGDLQCYGHPRIKTPHLDRLAGQGTRFTQFYMSHSVCSPSRASLLTGQYPSRWNLYAHLAWLRSNAQRGMPDWLAVAAPSLPRALQQAGYRTALFGKWHLGGGSGRNFGGNAINSADAPSAGDYGFDRARVVAGNGPTWRGTERREEAHDLYPYADAPFLTASSELIVDASLEFIADHRAKHRDQPFMVNLWLHDPHVPLKPTEAMRAPYEDIEDPARQAYYAVISNLDAQIGRLLARLDEWELGKNTLVIFTSDNGAAAREGSRATSNIAPGVALDTDTAGSNGPLRGWKWHLYEGGIRVPLLVRWPGHVPAGRVDADSVLHATDFFPTLLHAAGAAAPAGYRADGMDIGPALAGQALRREEPICWQNPTANRRGPSLAIRDGDWKLLMEQDGTDVQLYDLARDESESTNLVSENPAKVATLRNRLLVWSRSLPPPLDRVAIEPP